MRYFTRKLYNRLQLSGMFPFKSMESVGLFWDELYVSDYKLNHVYYERLIRDAMPEVVKELVEGERVIKREGPPEVFINLLKQVDQQWQDAYAAYEARYKAIEGELPECIIEVCKQALQDSRVIDVNMPEQGQLTLQLDTRFTDWDTEGIDQIILDFEGVKSVIKLGTIRLRNWLFSEVDIHPEGRFEFRILFEDGELNLVADSVKVKYHNRFTNIDAE